MNSARPIIGYLRVSTQKQGRSGLGLESQQKAIRQHAQQTGATIIAEYREVESGKRNDRPELWKAIRHAKRCKALLVVAKLDRLTRSVAFTSALIETKVEFVCCDMPHANKLTIHILAALAEYERELIGQRTRDALAAYKARGGKLGSHLQTSCPLTDAARKKGNVESLKTIREKFVEAYADLIPVIRERRDARWTLQKIADELNNEGHTTRTGATFKAVHIKRILERAPS